MDGPPKNYSQFVTLAGFLFFLLAFVMLTAGNGGFTILFLILGPLIWLAGREMQKDHQEALTQYNVRLQEELEGQRASRIEAEALQLEKWLKTHPELGRKIRQFAQRWLDAYDVSLKNPQVADPGFEPDVARFAEATGLGSYAELDAVRSVLVWELKELLVARLLAPLPANAARAAVFDAYLHWAGDEWPRNLWVPILMLTRRRIPVNRPTLEEELRARHAALAKAEYLAGLELDDVDPLGTHWDGGQFEKWMSRKMTRRGYAVQVVGKSGDQGADIIATKFGRTVVVQCKRYSVTVGNAAVQEAFAAMKHYGAQEAWVATNSRFTRSAQQLAKTTGVLLIDGDELQRF